MSKHMQCLLQNWKFSCCVVIVLFCCHCALCSILWKTLLLHEQKKTVFSFGNSKSSPSAFDSLVAIEVKCLLSNFDKFPYAVRQVTQLQFLFVCLLIASNSIQRNWVILFVICSYAFAKMEPKTFIGRQPMSDGRIRPFTYLELCLSIPVFANVKVFVQL